MTQPGKSSWLRFFTALYCARGARRIMKILRRNASHYPGVIALKICPDFLSKIATPKRVIIVTGSNGKTSTANLMADILRNCGLKVINNSLGSNLAEGIAALFISSCNLLGKNSHDYAVIEMDERSSHKVLPYLKTDAFVIGNLFRDSPRRNAHVEYMADFINAQIQPETLLVLNHDDPAVLSLGRNNKRVTFSLAPQKDEVECHTLVHDYPYCPICKHSLSYSFLRYDHIGNFECPNCRFGSDKADYILTPTSATDPQATTSNLVLTYDDKHYYLNKPNLNIPDSYNLLACLTTLHTLGISLELLNQAIEKTQVVYSRFATKTCGKYTITKRLAKSLNPLASSLAFHEVRRNNANKNIAVVYVPDYMLGKPLETQFWLYDTDFAFINVPQVKQLILHTPYAQDLKACCILAGIDPEKIIVTEQVSEVAAALKWSEIDTIYVFDDVYSQPVSAQVLSTIEQRAKEEQYA